jgi:hypothetical protein
MQDTYDDLSDFVRAKINEKGLNYRLVADRSNGLISHSVVYDIIKKRSVDPKVSTLKGLARGMSEPEETIFAIARGAKPKLERISNERFAKIAEGYLKLPKAERNSVEALLLAIEKTIELSQLSKSGKDKKEIIAVPDKGKLDDDTKTHKKKVA